MTRNFIKAFAALRYERIERLGDDPRRQAGNSHGTMAIGSFAQR